MKKLFKLIIYLYNMFCLEDFIKFLYHFKNNFIISDKAIYIVKTFYEQLNSTTVFLLVAIFLKHKAFSNYFFSGEVRIILNIY